MADDGGSPGMGVWRWHLACKIVCVERGERCGNVHSAGELPQGNAGLQRPCGLTIFKIQSWENRREDLCWAIENRSAQSLPLAQASLLCFLSTSWSVGLGVGGTVV